MSEFYVREAQFTTDPATAVYGPSRHVPREPSASAGQQKEDLPMSTFLCSAALAIVVTVTAVGSVFAAPNVLTRGSMVVTKANTPYASQAAKQRPCVSREVLDNVRHAFYDSCTGAFIRVDVR
jgi:hypothetical protein